MRACAIINAVFALLFCVYLQAETKVQKVTVTGKLVRAMAIGGESTGWAIETDADVSIDGHTLRSLEVSYPKTERLEKLANKQVRARGKITHRHGVETGDRLVLELTSIRELKGKTAAPASAFNLNGEWLLEDMAGSGVIDNVQSTLEFADAGKAVGNGGCNRFFGTVESQGETIKFGPLASSRKMCPEAVMNQEGKYLSALQSAERYEWKDPYLLIYCKGMEKPLRFTRVGKS